MASSSVLAHLTSPTTNLTNSIERTRTAALVPPEPGRCARPAPARTRLGTRSLACRRTVRTPPPDRAAAKAKRQALSPGPPSSSPCAPLPLPAPEHAVAPLVDLRHRPAAARRRACRAGRRSSTRRSRTGSTSASRRVSLSGSCSCFSSMPPSCSTRHCATPIHSPILCVWATSRCRRYRSPSRSRERRTG